MIFDKNKPVEERRHQTAYPSIEELLNEYNDETKYTVYVLGRVVNVIIKEK